MDKNMVHSTVQYISANGQKHVTQYSTNKFWQMDKSVLHSANNFLQVDTNNFRQYWTKSCYRSQC